MTPEQRRDKLLQARYNITLAEWQEILARQSNKCALCGRDYIIGKKFSVDHDHQSGEVRGILCYACNRYKLGNLLLEDVKRMLDYLLNPPARQVFGEPRVVPPDKVNPPKRRRGRAKKNVKKT